MRVREGSTFHVLAQFLLPSGLERLSRETIKGQLKISWSNFLCQRKIWTPFSPFFDFITSFQGTKILLMM